MLDRDAASARHYWNRAVNCSDTNPQHFVAFVVGEPRPLAGIYRHHNPVCAGLDAVRNTTPQRIVVNAPVLVEWCDRYREYAAILALRTL